MIIIGSDRNLPALGRLILREMGWTPIEETMVRWGGDVERVWWLTVGWRDHGYYRVTFLVSKNKKRLGISFINEELTEEASKYFNTQIYVGHSTGIGADVAEAMIETINTGYKLESVTEGRHHLLLEFSNGIGHVTVRLNQPGWWANIYGKRELAERVARIWESKGFDTKIIEKSPVEQGWERNPKALYA